MNFQEVKNTSILNKFIKAIETFNHKINIYKYTDYIMKLDENLHKIKHYDILIKHIRIIYYYQIIIFYKTFNVNKNITNYLKYSYIINNFITTNNDIINGIYLGFISYNYLLNKFEYLENYDDLKNSIITKVPFKNL